MSPRVEIAPGDAGGSTGASRGVPAGTNHLRAGLFDPHQRTVVPQVAVVEQVRQTGRTRRRIPVAGVAGRGRTWPGVMPPSPDS
jgi:hypothetical protein